MKNPHAGIFANITTEVAGLGGDAEFVKVTGRGTYYHTLSEELDIVGLLSAGGGHIAGFGDDGLRIFDQFQSNDRMIRGFEFGGIGPIDADTERPSRRHDLFQRLGRGAIPGAGRSGKLRPARRGLRRRSDALRQRYRVCAGLTVAGDGMEWRASVGAGLIWASPFGPLRIDYAVPVVKEEIDEVQEFNFGISTRF